MKIQTGYLYHIKDEILDNFKYLLKLKTKGINLFFTDTDKIKELMLNETETVYN